MAINTITDFTAAVVADDTAAVAAASLELTTASAAAGVADSAVQAAAKAVEAQSSAIAALRAQLAAAPTATDALALADALLQLEMTLHERTAQLSAAQHGNALARARVARASARVGRVKEALDASTAADQAAAADAKAWLDNVTPAVVALRNRAPAMSAAAAAVKAAGAEPYQTAEARVGTEVPLSLRTPARGRLATLQGQANQAATDEAAAEVAAAAKYGTHLGKSGAVIVARLDYARKRKRLRELADAERRLADAIATLTAIATAPPESPAAAGRRAAARAAAAAALQARDRARQDVQDQQALIDAKQLEIDAAAPADQPPLEAEKGLLEAARVPLDDALVAADAKLVAANDVAEDSVSEEAWRRLQAFDAAAEQLTELAALTTARIDQIRTEASDAEKVLATALKAESDARGEIATAEAVVVEKRDAAVATRELAQAQLVSALRGDL